MFRGPRSAAPFILKLFLSSLQTFWEPRWFQLIIADPNCANSSSSNYKALHWATQEATELSQATISKYLKRQKEKMEGGKPSRGWPDGPVQLFTTLSVWTVGFLNWSWTPALNTRPPLFQPVHFLFNHTTWLKEDKMETERMWKRRLRSAGHPGMLLTHIHSSKSKKILQCC